MGTQKSLENLQVLVVDDEPLLRQRLSQQITELWPACQQEVLTAADSVEALRKIEDHSPNIIFLDIRMPGIDGLSLAKRILEFTSPPRVVFTTAYADYALEAFEVNAIDYLLKPISSERLQNSLDRLEKEFSIESTLNADRKALSLDTIERVLSAMDFQPKEKYLEWIKASQRDNLHLLSVYDVQYFQSSDKYTNVVTTDSEYIIRTSIKELVSQLDPSLFWQIHRSTLVNSRFIDVVKRDFSGRLRVSIKDSNISLSVSRNFRSLFKQN